MTVFINNDDGTLTQATEMDNLADVLYNGDTLPVDKDGVILLDGEDACEPLYFPSLHPVKVNGKYGFANENNQLVIDAVYDRVKPFKNNRAKVSQHNKYGFIDRSGNLVIPIIYERAGDFYEKTTTVVLNGITYTINLEGKTV